ncbi:peptidase inhibitor family I36 protein [Kitasatospora aureofaciens]
MRVRVIGFGVTADTSDVGGVTIAQSNNDTAPLSLLEAVSDRTLRTTPFLDWTMSIEEPPGGGGRLELSNTQTVALVNDHLTLFPPQGDVYQLQQPVDHTPAGGPAGQVVATLLQFPVTLTQSTWPAPPRAETATGSPRPAVRCRHQHDIPYLVSRKADTMSDEQAQLIYGQGQEACPDGTFCLYRATNFNIGQTPGVGDKILAIPLGTYVNDFSVYGFDHSGDGVSSVVNNTDADNALFSAADQRGHSLPVDRRSSIANLARIAMADSPNGSWNDQAQSALAAPFLGNLVVEQECKGKWQDWESQKWIYSYRITVRAEETRVVKWALGFGDLPEGTILYKGFTDVFWGQVLSDGTDGSVLLASPERGGHTIDPGTDLLIDIQVLYPNEDRAHEHLTSLNAQHLG